MTCEARNPDYPLIRCELPNGHPQPFTFVNDADPTDPIIHDHGAPTQGAYWTGTSPVDLIELAIGFYRNEGRCSDEEEMAAEAWLARQIRR